MSMGHIMAGTWLQFVFAICQRSTWSFVGASALHTIISTMALDLQLQVQLHNYREEPLQPADVTHGYESDPPVST